MAGFSQLLSRKNIHPLVLDAALLEALGHEWMGWDSDSTAMALERKYHTPTSRANLRKLDALGVLHSNHAFWENWRAFEACCWALSGKEIGLAQVTPLTSMPLVYGVRTARWIDTVPVYSDEVQAYITAVFLEEQFSLVPPDVKFVQARVFEKRPDLMDRADKVKAAIVSGTQGSLEDVGEDPVKVEVTRHQVLNSLIKITCSHDALLSQAEQYGLRDIVARVLGGSK
jgi:hypothetical protein